MPDDIAESTLIHLRLGDVIGGNQWHEKMKRPLGVDCLKSLLANYDNKKYVIGGKKKITKEEIVNETFKSFVQKLSPKLGKSYATNLAGTIAAAKRKGAGKGPTAKQKARMK